MYELALVLILSAIVYTLAAGGNAAPPVHDPEPWSCSGCGARLQWRRRALVCPNHGVLHALPAWPEDRKDTE